MVKNKTTILIFVLLMVIGVFSIPANSHAETCEDCPAHNPCIINIPAGDRCNTCQYKVHCSEGQWYRNPTFECTTFDCTRFIPIDNPFEHEKDL